MPILISVKIVKNLKKRKMGKNMKNESASGRDGSGMKRIKRTE
jgi:hypothetical protein